MSGKGLFGRLFRGKSKTTSPPTDPADVDVADAEGVDVADVEDVDVADVEDVDVADAEGIDDVVVEDFDGGTVDAVVVEIASAAGEAEVVASLDDMVEEAPQGWLGRLKSGLTKSSSKLTTGIGDLFTKRKLDDEALEDLQDLLITTDLGVGTAARVTKRLAKARFGQDVDADDIKAVLADEVAQILAPVAIPLQPACLARPHVILVVGVNGSGKTTTIGKMAKHFKDQGKKVSLAAGDTFRAAAVEQLKVWGERTNCPVIARETGADAAGLAYDAMAESARRGDDLLFIDTAGRLQNKADLMDELRKVVRVIKKQDETAPHDVLLVLDATVGQNAHSQVEVFKDIVAVTGLILTKLDGTARGGVLVALAEKFGLPVHAIGVGEKVEDLRPFDAKAFARSLVGLD